MEIAIMWIEWEILLTFASLRQQLFLNFQPHFRNLGTFSCRILLNKVLRGFLHGLCGGTSTARKFFHIWEVFSRILKTFMSFEWVKINPSSFPSLRPSPYIRSFQRQCETITALTVQNSITSLISFLENKICIHIYVYIETPQMSMRMSLLREMREILRCEGRELVTFSLWSLCSQKC